MKSSTQLAKKLSAYSLFAGAFLAAEKSDAQIIYTAVNDTVHIDGDAHAFDLDNDGNFEFFLFGAHPGNFDLYWSVAAGLYWSVQFVVEGYFSYSLAYAAQPLDAGVALCDFVPHLQENFSASAYLFFVVNGVNKGFWQPGDTGKFIGIREYSNIDFMRHYAWLRLDVAPDTSYIIVRDYAYNATPVDCKIKTGEVAAPCIDNYEPNNSSPQASLIPVNKKIQGLIDVPGDHDWFEFTLPADKNNIRVVLKKLPANYNIKMYDQNFQLLGSSKHPATFNDTIVYNNLDISQHYYVAVKGQNVNAYDANDCYTLRVEASSDPYKLVDSSASVQEFTEVEIFPNPSSEKIFISDLNENINSSEVSVYDLSGRKMFSQQISSSENSLDISSLAEGMYLLELKNENETLVKKFEVKR